MVVIAHKSISIKKPAQQRSQSSISITTPLFPLFNKKQTMTISNGGSRGVSEGGYLNISCSIIDRYCSWGTRNCMRVLRM